MNEMISGVWVNKNTGEKIVVSNTIIDGNDMILITNIGQLSMEEFSRNYIQASDDIYDESGKVIDSKPVNVEDIITPTKSNTAKVVDIFDAPVSKKQKAKEPEEYTVLDKFFNKIDDNDKEQLIDININFDVLPIEKFKTLIEYLDIDKTIIAQYISEKLINNEAIKNIILNKVEKYL